jgi:hypothetical protein
MNDNSPFLILDQSCNQAVDWVVDRFSQAGLSVIRTFDLQDARGTQFTCLCPHHGTDLCDCQMVVLFVYEGSKEPLALVAHGYNCQTWFTVVDTPQQRPDPYLEMTIRQVVSQSLPYVK